MSHSITRQWGDYVRDTHTVPSLLLEVVNPIAKDIPKTINGKPRKIFNTKTIRKSGLKARFQERLYVSILSNYRYSKHVWLELFTSCSATFWQLLVFRAIFLHSEQFLYLSSNYDISEQLLVLKLAFLLYQLHVLVDNLWISCKKRSQILPLPPWGRSRRKIKVAGLLSQRFLETENSKWWTLRWTKIHTRLTWVSRVKKVI